MGSTIERPPMPTEERKPAWRAACLAYREKSRAGASDQEAHEAAVAAVQDVWPLPWKEATRSHSRSVPATDSCTAAKPPLGATPSSTRAREEQAWLVASTLVAVVYAKSRLHTGSRLLPPSSIEWPGRVPPSIEDQNVAISCLACRIRDRRR